MLISKKYRFLFIHIFKTGGTSVTSALLPFCTNRWPRRVKSFLKRHNILRLDPQPYFKHAKASELVAQLGREVFDSYFSFAFVRNPWDWQVSLYTYICKEVDHYQHRIVNGFRDFDEFIRWRCREARHYQRDFIYSANGEQLVDFVGRFERLEEDFQTICARLGVCVRLPKLNVSNTKPYQEYYNKETIELVRRKFQSDIDAFGYEFE